jgi:hypothetical protein
VFVLAIGLGAAGTTTSQVAIPSVMAGSDADGLFNLRPYRRWAFTRDRPSTGTREINRGTQHGGELYRRFDFGTNIFDVDGDGITSLEVYSSADGLDFWVAADAPLVNPANPNSLAGSQADLTQIQGFVKLDPSASLVFEISEALLGATDLNGGMLPQECPWTVDLDSDSCTEQLWGRISYSGLAYDAQGPLLDAAGYPVFYRDASALIIGHGGRWSFASGTNTFVPAWVEGNFSFEVGGDGDEAQIRASLLGELELEVDLSAVRVGAEFSVISHLTAHAYNYRGRESAIGAYLRDPGKIGGTSMRYTGLRPTDQPLPPPAPNLAPVPCPAGSNPDAGVLQFAAPAWEFVERAGGGLSGVSVIRTGGSQGAVTATLTSDGGTAIPGTQFVPITIQVQFGDGDITPRTVPLEILPNATVESATPTIDLTLSDPGGCATLGDPSTAVVRILDDDQAAPVPATYTVGGTVTGLIGQRLVLENHNGLLLQVLADGPFTFSDIPSPSGTEYFVGVFKQPDEPSQVCNVINGEGTFTDHDVTDVEVRCVPP